MASELVERRVGIALGGAGLGWAERKSFYPLSVLGLPSKLAIGVGAMLIEANSSGPIRRMMGALADSSLAVYSYQAIKTESFIAGDDVGEDYVGEELS
jgi:hypothetical protein